MHQRHRKNSLDQLWLGIEHESWFLPLPNENPCLRVTHGPANVGKRSLPFLFGLIRIYDGLTSLDSEAQSSRCLDDLLV
jgi:hypothetical protein